MAKRVMVVDDSRIQEVQIRKMLEGSGYEVVCYCRSGEDALAQYDGVKPDVVTMEHPDARIIMVSSLAYDDTFEEAKSIGAKAFLSKPFDAEQLVAALDHATLG